MREALIAARAICSVSDSPHGIWESLPGQTDPNATASKILQQWSTAQRIESERLVQALAAAKEFTKQVQSSATTTMITANSPR